MDNRKQQKFYVGQKVVCVKDHSHGFIKRGQVFTVTGINYCCEFNVEINHCSGRIGHRCTKCSATISSSTYGQQLFAPYDPPAIEIPAELLEVDVKDGIDVNPVKELI